MGETPLEILMKTFVFILMAPFITLAFMIAAEQEDTTTFDSGACPEYPDHDEAWYEYEPQR